MSKPYKNLSRQKFERWYGRRHKTVPLDVWKEIREHTWKYWKFGFLAGAGHLRETERRGK